MTIVIKRGKTGGHVCTQSGRTHTHQLTHNLRKNKHTILRTIYANTNIYAQFTQTKTQTFLTLFIKGNYFPANDFQKLHL